MAMDFPVFTLDLDSARQRWVGSLRAPWARMNSTHSLRRNGGHAWWLSWSTIRSF